MGPLGGEPFPGWITRRCPRERPDRRGRLLAAVGVALAGVLIAGTTAEGHPTSPADSAASAASLTDRAPGHDGNGVALVARVPGSPSGSRPVAVNAVVAAPPTQARTQPATVGADAVLDDLAVSYRVAVAVAWKAGTLAVEESITIVNRSPVRVASLNLAVVPREGGRFTVTTPPTATGRELRWTWSTPVNLHLDFGVPVEPGAIAIVDLAYRLLVDRPDATLATRLGRTAGILNIGNAFAVVSRERGFYPIGDPVVSRSADSWDVAVTTDVAMRRDAVAASGALVEGPPSSASGRRWTFHADRLREFALAISPSFHRTSAQLGTTTISAYTVRLSPDRLLGPAIAAFRAYTAWYGPYPRSGVSIVEIGGGNFSQEYSALVFISPDVAEPRHVAHEIAHLWWFDLVGSDQVLDPFFDESLAEYSARKVSGFDGPSCSTRALGLTVFDFRPELTEAARQSCDSYSRTIYRRGAIFWDHVGRVVGTAAFYRTLRAFVSAHRFDFTGSGALLDAFAAENPRSAAALRRLEVAYGLVQGRRQ